jgi:hypothetical protein
LSREFSVFAQAVRAPDKPRLKLLEKLPRVTILQHVEPDGTAWGTSNRAIVRVRDGRGEVLGRLPASYPGDLLGWSRLAARALRTDRSNLYVNRHRRVIVIRNGRVWRIDDSPFTLHELGAIQGDSFLNGGICEDAAGNVYFGEYFRNPQRESVRVWRVNPAATGMEVAHEFPAGSIRHVHGVFWDPHETNRLWIATGDYEDECYLFATDPTFRRLERIGEGTQTWRAVTLYFTPDYVCWITDSHLEPNHACRWRRRDGALEMGQAIDCPAWHGLTTAEGDYVACTAVEDGPGVLSDQASVLVSRDAFHWAAAASFAKDSWRPRAVFKTGVISCPTGVNRRDGLYLSGQALRGFDGTTMRFRLEWPNDVA